MSTPHLYLSALPFAPKASNYVSLFSEDYCGLAKVDGRLEEWPYALKTLIGHKSAVNSVAFSPDGKRVVSGSDDYCADMGR